MQSQVFQRSQKVGANSLQIFLVRTNTWKGRYTYWQVTSEPYMLA